MKAENLAEGIMPAGHKKALEGFVNSSGFLLQLALKHSVEQLPQQGWRVLSHEHPWKDLDTGRDGFIDLVLAAR